MKHIQTFSNSGDVQTALNEETLIKPYVALVSGTSLDYNSLEPVQPCYLGEWSDNGQGTYTFQILDVEASAWENFVNIGQLMGVYFNGGQTDMDVQVQFDGSYAWSIYLIPAGGDPSDGDSYFFTEDNPESWTSSTMTDPDASNSPVTVTWDGTDTFVLTATQDYPLSMNTINPECE